MKKEMAGIPRLTDLITMMERIAPPSLAEAWDNSGLQIGSGEWSIRRIWVALDPLPAVVHAASERGVDLLVTHHPLFFNPIKQLDLATSLGQVIETAIKGRMAIYSAHTNLDSTHDGINDILAKMIGIKDTQALVPAKEAMEIDGQVRESRMIGLGRIGDLDHPASSVRVAEKLKKRFDLQSIRMAGSAGRKIRRVAVCSGAGGSLLDLFLKSDADLYISGDFRYHDARTVEEAGKAMIDLGHFASERIIIDVLVHKLAEACRNEGYAISVEPCNLEHDPFESV